MSTYHIPFVLHNGLNVYQFGWHSEAKLTVVTIDQDLSQPRGKHQHFSAKLGRDC